MNKKILIGLLVATSLTGGIIIGEKSISNNKIIKKENEKILKNNNIDIEPIVSNDDSKNTEELKEEDNSSEARGEGSKIKVQDTENKEAKQDLNNKNAANESKVENSKVKAKEGENKEIKQNSTNKNMVDESKVTVSINTILDNAEKTLKTGAYKDGLEMLNKLKERVVNKEGKAKIEYLEAQIKLAMQTDGKIKKAEEFCNNGEYKKARNILENLDAILSDKQRKNRDNLLKKCSENDKISNTEFTYEKALKILQEVNGYDSNLNYEYFQEDEHQGVKRIFIRTSRKDDPMNGELYLVWANGKVISAS